ncbi:uncharacterized protein AB675_4424 [Cyphellophora attinorum]|uniref:Uncharacterized protein n=1 Tax=Cyphellophora attinorum TaxID=1664694 RepID=A0A0N1GZM2_9EURO|nr:uncharacterized protein AB675_4424 [Phialophora attinorum]KPI36584.1 hypothetical protein AB675_4424 [Phialophora attinorum]
MAAALMQSDRREATAADGPASTSARCAIAIQECVREMNAAHATNKDSIHHPQAFEKAANEKNLSKSLMCDQSMKKRDACMDRLLEMLESSKLHDASKQAAPADQVSGAGLLHGCANAEKRNIELKAQLRAAYGRIQDLAYLYSEIEPLCIADTSTYPDTGVEEPGSANLSCVRHSQQIVKRNDNLAAHLAVANADVESAESRKNILDWSKRIERYKEGHRDGMKAQLDLIKQQESEREMQEFVAFFRQSTARWEKVQGKQPER